MVRTTLFQLLLKTVVEDNKMYCGINNYKCTKNHTVYEKCVVNKST